MLQGKYNKYERRWKFENHDADKITANKRGSGGGSGASGFLTEKMGICCIVRKMGIYKIKVKEHHPTGKCKFVAKNSGIVFA